MPQRTAALAWAFGCGPATRTRVFLVVEASWREVFFFFGGGGSWRGVGRGVSKSGGEGERKKRERREREGEGEGLGERGRRKKKVSRGSRRIPSFGEQEKKKGRAASEDPKIRPLWFLLIPTGSS